MNNECIFLYVSQITEIISFERHSFLSLPLSSKTHRVVQRLAAELLTCKPCQNLLSLQ